MQHKLVCFSAAFKGKSLHFLLTNLEYYKETSDSVQMFFNSAMEGKEFCLYIQKDIGGRCVEDGRSKRSAHMHAYVKEALESS